MHKNTGRVIVLLWQGRAEMLYELYCVFVFRYTVRKYTPFGGTRTFLMADIGHISVVAVLLVDPDAAGGAHYGGCVRMMSMALPIAFARPPAAPLLRPG